MPQIQSVDILVITALHEEYEQLLAVRAGARVGPTWDRRPGPLGHEVAVREFTSDNGTSLNVLATWATGMGGVATAGLAERLIAEYSPRCLAMCGVCAGRRGDVNIGDVIVADRLWLYDAGKLKVEYDSEGQRSERVQGDMLMYNLRADWKKAAESFRIPEEIIDSWGTRPIPSDMQAHWILERLVNNEDPRKHPDKPMRAPNWGQVLEIVWKKGWLEDGSLTLTDTGRKHIKEHLLRHDDVLPKLGPFAVRVGPVATGNKVVQDPKIFDRLSDSMRKVIGLEMEAMAIGAVAHEHQDKLRFVVMKAVMDYADEWKNDTAKTFAARASAECLLLFLRKNLPALDNGVAKGETAVEKELSVGLALGPISGPMRGRLAKALAEAFPNESALKRLLQYGLGKNLADIAGERRPLPELIFDVLETSEAEGWTGRLIAAARAQNETHEGLREVTEALIAGRTK